MSHERPGLAFDELAIKVRPNDGTTKCMDQGKGEIPLSDSYLSQRGA